jgi:hypothetical protein
VVALGAVGFIFTIVFLLFSYSLSGYKLLDLRQGVQGDALKARASLEHDFTLSHFDSAGAAERTLNNQLGGPRRDAVCLLSISHWNDPARFDSMGLPLWDRYIVYYADTDREQGRLTRLELTPDPAPAPGQSLRIAPLSTGDLATIEDGPPDGFMITNRQTILEDLTQLEIQVDIPTQTVSVSLASRRQDGGARTGGARRIDEGMEAVFDFDPINTSPRL